MKTKMLGLLITLILGLGISALGAEFIVDNDSTETDGTWSSSTYQPNYYGADYAYVNSGSGSLKIRWRPNLTQAGDYEVYYRLPDGATNRAQDAPFTVFYGEVLRHILWISKFLPEEIGFCWEPTILSLGPRVMLN